MNGPPPSPTPPRRRRANGVGVAVTKIDGDCCLGHVQGKGLPGERASAADPLPRATQILSVLHGELELQLDLTAALADA